MAKLEWLRAFVVFADHMNLTHAADLMNISQPALHTQINNLAEDFGVDLYLRKGRRLELTEDGLQVAAFGRDILEKFEVFTKELHGGKDRQPVILASGEGAYLYLLGQALVRYTETSGTTLSLMNTDRVGSLDALRAGKAHLAVTTLDSIPDDLETELISRLHSKVIVRHDHRLARSKDLTINDLDGEAFVIPPRERPFRVTLERIFNQHGVSWTKAVESVGWPLTIHFVELGLGIAIVNGCVNLPDTLVGKTIYEFPPTDYYLIYRKRTLERTAVNTLRMCILGKLGEISQKQ